MYKIRVNQVADENVSVKGYASLTFNDQFKVSGIQVIKNKNDELFVKMPQYRTSKVDKSNNPIFEDVCFPTTAEGRKMLEADILMAAETMGKDVTFTHEDYDIDVNNMSINVVPLEKEENSKSVGYASVTFDDKFAVKNISIFNRGSSPESAFVSMPSKKNKNGEYASVCHPVGEFTKELYGAIKSEYESKMGITPDMKEEKKEKKTAKKTATKPKR